MTIFIFLKDVNNIDGTKDKSQKVLIYEMKLFYNEEKEGMV